MNYFKWVLGLIVWCLSAGLFAQEKLTKQQQADLDKAVKEAEAEMAKFKDPAYINKLFDNQIKEFKANGAATPELLKEIEKARAEMLKMAKGSGVSASPKPVAEEPDEPIETAQVAGSSSHLVKVGVSHQDDSFAEQLKTRSSIHLTLDIFEPVY
ncbi:hypothetical protein, partial [Runella sp.]|uniref:hypothetical protein n=1 Tax=Runella sp. TaxID=1960881 RepID=UPI00261C77EF